MGDEAPIQGWNLEDTRVLLGAQEVLGEEPDYEWASGAASSLDPNYVVRLFTLLNRRFYDGMTTREEQRPVAGGVFRVPSIRRRVDDNLAKPDGERLWYEPSVGLFGIRLLASNCTGGPSAIGEAVQTDTLSRWLLHLSGFVAAETGGPRDPDEPVTWVAWELAQWNLHSTENLHGLFARTAWLLFGERDADIAASPNFIDTQYELEQLLGVRPMTYLSLLFGLYSSIRAPEKAPIGVIVEWDKWSATDLSHEEFALSLERASMDFDRLSQRYEETRAFAGDGPTNILPFIEHPLLQLPDGGCVCPSLRLLENHIRDALYHVLWNHYREVEGRPDNRFTRFWGELTESYVRALFAEVVCGSGPMRTLWFGKDLTYGQPQQEAVDIIVECPNELLFVEVTSSTLTLSAMCLRDAGAVQRDLNNSIVGKTRQLDRCITDFRQGEITFPDAAPSPEKRIVPVVITPGFTPSFPPSRSHIRDAIRHESLLEQDRVLPLQVFSLADLEFILNYAASGQVVAELFANKAAADNGHVGATFPQWVRDEELPDPTARHPLLERTFQDFIDDIGETLFPGQALA